MEAILDLILLGFGIVLLVRDSAEGAEDGRPQPLPSGASRGGAAGDTVGPCESDQCPRETGNGSSSRQGRRDAVRAGTAGARASVAAGVDACDCGFYRGAACSRA